MSHLRKNISVSGFIFKNTKNIFEYISSVKLILNNEKKYNKIKKNKKINNQHSLNNSSL